MKTTLRVRHKISGVKPHHQRVEENAFHLSADESRWIGFSEDDVSKEAEHFRNGKNRELANFVREFPDKL